MKRFLCIFLSVVLILSACLIVFAEDVSGTQEYTSDKFCSDYEYESEDCPTSEPDTEITTAMATTAITESTTKVVGIPNLPQNGNNSSDSAGSADEWRAFQHLSITFFVSVNSLATVSYHAVAEKNSKIEATVYFEKLVLGKWERVSVGTNSNKFTNRASGSYISGTQTVQVNGNGKYRAVVEVKNAYGSASGSTEFVFNVNSSLADVNLDGRVTAMDVRLALRFAAGLQRYALDQKSRGDVNGDGQLTAADARIILRISAKLM